jgi:hypothetical protein
MSITAIIARIDAYQHERMIREGKAKLAETKLVPGCVEIYC